MDPLSVAASVVGLLTAAAKVITLLEHLSEAQQCPTTIKEAQTEVKHAELALRSLQRYLQRLDLVDPQRAALIEIDELRVVLSDAMLAFAEFEDLLELLSRMMLMRVAITWHRHSKKIDEHRGKIQRYVSSLNLMLNILQCERHLEASHSQQRLHLLVEEVLLENKKLKLLLIQSKDTFDAQSTFTRRTAGDDMTIRPSDDNSDDGKTIYNSGNHHPVRNSAMISEEAAFAFENILQQSWVYRRNERNECDASFVSSVQRSHAWSVFTGYSLADISILSVIAMPLTLNELINAHHYAEYHETETADRDNVDGSSKNDLSAQEPIEAIEPPAPTMALSDASGLTPDVENTESDANDLLEDMMDRISSSPSIDGEDDIDFQFVYALHTFAASVEGQISVTKGDCLVLLDDSNSYWWLVRATLSRSIGYIPSEHVETPLERLGRLNKHRNLELGQPMPDELNKTAIKRKSTHKKRVAFGDSIIYLEPPSYDSSSEEEADSDREDATSVIGAGNAHSTSTTGEMTGGTSAVDQIDKDSSEDAQDPAELSETNLGTVEQTPRSLPLKPLVLGAHGRSRSVETLFNDGDLGTKKLTLTPSLLREDSTGRSDYLAVTRENSGQVPGKTNKSKVRRLLAWRDRSRSEGSISLDNLSLTPSR